jgi:hypothetical protein
MTSNIPVLVIRDAALGLLEYMHAAPGLRAAGLWAALKCPPAQRGHEQAQIIYTWLQQLRSEALLQRLQPSTLLALAAHSLEASYHSTFDICMHSNRSLHADALFAASRSGRSSIFVCFVTAT